MNSVLMFWIVYPVIHISYLCLVKNEKKIRIKAVMSKNTLIFKTTTCRFLRDTWSAILDQIDTEDSKKHRAIVNNPFTITAGRTLSPQDITKKHLQASCSGSQPWSVRRAREEEEVSLCYEWKELDGGEDHNHANSANKFRHSELCLRYGIIIKKGNFCHLSVRDNQVQFQFQFNFNLKCNVDTLSTLVLLKHFFTSL